MHRVHIRGNLQSIRIRSPSTHTMKLAYKHLQYITECTYEGVCIPSTCIRGSTLMSALPKYTRELAHHFKGHLHTSTCIRGSTLMSALPKHTLSTREHQLQRRSHLHNHSHLDEGACNIRCMPSSMLHVDFYNSSLHWFHSSNG